MIKASLKAIFKQVYPDFCNACQTPLKKDEEFICLSCDLDLPKTNFHLIEENELKQKFKGLIDIQKAVSLYIYNKGGGVQQLIHALKYSNAPDLAKFLGCAYAKLLIKSSFFNDIDAIVPIAMHPKKIKSRGYNQANEIAKGIQSVSDLPIFDDWLIKITASKSQTKQTRLERFENVKMQFQLENFDLDYNHILLVDDVITTGATSEAAASLLINAGFRVSILSIAVRLD